MHVASLARASAAAPALLLTACLSMAVARPAAVAPGVSAHAKLGVSGAMGREAAWFHEFSLDDGCPRCDPARRRPVGELSLLYGWRDSWIGRPASVGVVLGTFSLAEAYVQLHEGTRVDLGVGVRAGWPRWGAQQAFFLGDVRLGRRTALLVNPGYYRMTYREWNAESFLGRKDGITSYLAGPTLAAGLAIDVGPLTISPTVAYAAVHGSVILGPFEPDWTTAHPFRDRIVTGWIGLSGRNSRGR